MLTTDQAKHHAKAAVSPSASFGSFESSYSAVRIGAIGSKPEWIETICRSPADMILMTTSHDCEHQSISRWRGAGKFLAASLANRLAATVAICSPSVPNGSIICRNVSLLPHFSVSRGPKLCMESDSDAIHCTGKRQGSCGGSPSSRFLDGQLSR